MVARRRLILVAMIALAASAAGAPVAAAPASAAGAPVAAAPAENGPQAGDTGGEERIGVPLEAFGLSVGHLLAGVSPRASSVNAACLVNTPVEWRAGQIVIAGLVQSELGAAAEAARRGRLGGVFVLGSPDAAVADGLAALDAAARLGSGADALATVDEEGGRVQRLSSLLGPIPPARELAGLDVDSVGEVIAAHAVRVAELGFDSMLGPVVDVGGGPAIGNRSFADDPDSVAELAAAAADAMIAAGLLPVFKHFPGHGRASADSHLALAETPPIEELRGVDVRPYETLLDGRPDAAVMIGHLDVPGLTDGAPASISTAAVDGLLRSVLRFDGLVMTDALGMRAVADRYPPPQATVLALAAGVDAVLVDDLATVDPVIDATAAAVASGGLDDLRLAEAAGRVLAARGASGCSLALIADLWG